MPYNNPNAYGMQSPQLPPQGIPQQGMAAPPMGGGMPPMGGGRPTVMPAPMPQPMPYPGDVTQNPELTGLIDMERRRRLAAQRQFLSNNWNQLSPELRTGVMENRNMIRQNMMDRRMNRMQQLPPEMRGQYAQNRLGGGTMPRPATPGLANITPRY